MNKSRKSKAENSFRYQRVDLSRDPDSTDSEDDLDRILGPSSSPSMQHNSNKTRKKKNKCAVYCSLLMLFITFAVFGGVIVFATITYPGGIQEALARARAQFYQFDKENGTNNTILGWSNVLSKKSPS